MSIDEALEQARNLQRQLDELAADGSTHRSDDARQAALTECRAARDRAIVAAWQAGTDPDTIADATGCTRASARWAVESASEAAREGEDPADQ